MPTSTHKAIFDKPNVLVTGGAGFIGSHLCDQLVKTRHVICLDNFSSGAERNIDHLLVNPDFEFIRHDLTAPVDLESLAELEKFRIKFQGLQEIYHLACPTSPKDFESSREATVLANSLATKHALDLAVKYRAKMLHASSSVVYGPRRPDLRLFPEHYFGYVDPIGPRACYDEGKRFAETLVTTYRSVHDLDAKIVRIFRTYGTRMRLNDGQMLPDFVSAALDGKDLVIYGDESFSSSFCHVSDIVEGILKIMNSGEQGPINLGSDLDYRMADVARKVVELTASKSQIVFRQPLLFMSPLGLPDLALAKERLGWFAVTLLEDGLKEVIDYLKAYKPLVEMQREIG